MPTYTAPGVFIEELPATGPISGVGTSTAAFIGPASQGPIGQPIKITNWTQFKDNFGKYMTNPRYYLAYAVEGFFRNGGGLAYVVRVGTAVRASLDLADGAGGTALHVEARQEGVGGNNITVEVQNAPLVTSVAVTRAEATITTVDDSKTNITVTEADAKNFRVGDWVMVDGKTDRSLITKLSKAVITVASNLPAAAKDAKLRMADLISGQKTFRVQQTAGLQAGSVITITQGSVKDAQIVDKVAADFLTLSHGLTQTFALATAANPITIASTEFTLIVRSPNQTEPFENLSLDSRHSRYFGKIVNSTLVTVALPEIPSAAQPPKHLPKEIAATQLANGAADDLSQLTSQQYRDALDTLTRVQDVNMVCIPDRTDQDVQQALITHCETMGRFAILDPEQRMSVAGIQGQRAQLESTKGYAALYYPCLYIADPTGADGQTILIPPSGHIAGIYARSDNQRGVHKAPANELIAGALRLEQQLTDGELGELNSAGINVIRTFPNSARPNVWGARTTAPAAEAPWRYVNVRRLLLYIEASIKEGVRWAVFEPNDLALWQKLKRTINEFLTRVWQAGALFGATPQEAFYVKCDEELNPAAVRALGQVIIEIGVAPVRPAEFVIIRIGQWDSGSQVSEA